LGLGLCIAYPENGQADANVCSLLANLKRPMGSNRHKNASLEDEQFYTLFDPPMKHF
jgi:hypothetical protein